VIALERILTDGLVLSLAFTALVVGSLKLNYRLWIQDFPPDIRAMVPPKTGAEKRQTVLVAVPLFAIILTGPLVSVLLTEAAHGQLGFLRAWLHAYLVWQVVNVWDLLVLDWIGFLFVDPANPPIPGTAGAKGYRDYLFHFVGFLKGSAMGVVIAAVPAGLAMLL
jgi:hypothetical protein